MVTFYIARSIDEKITKVGITRTLKSRLINLKSSDRVDYILVYESPEIDRDKGVMLEKAIYEEFKEDIIVGKERFTTHPRLIIQFVSSLVEKEKLYKDAIYRSNIIAKYEHGRVGFKKAKGAKIFNPDIITDSKFISYLHLYQDGSLRTLAFVNIYDAINVSKDLDYRVKAFKYIPKLLYGMQREEYYEELSQYKQRSSPYIVKSTIYLPFDYKPVN